VFNDFPTVKKFDAMRKTRTEAGFVESDGNDVLQMLSSGPYDMNAGDSVQVTFALLGARSEELLMQVADSAYARVHGSPIVSVGEVLEETSITIYPNPSSGILTIQSDNIIDEVTIFNQTGQVVYRSKNTKMCNISTLHKGIYFVQVKHSKGISQTKLIRN
jgi:hypothetical protein